MFYIFVFKLILIMFYNMLHLRCMYWSIQAVLKTTGDAQIDQPNPARETVDDPGCETSPSSKKGIVKGGGNQQNGKLQEFNFISNLVQYFCLYYWNFIVSKRAIIWKVLPKHIFWSGLATPKLDCWNCLNHSQPHEVANYPYGGGLASPIIGKTLGVALCCIHLY